MSDADRGHGCVLKKRSVEVLFAGFGAVETILEEIEVPAVFPLVFPKQAQKNTWKLSQRVALVAGRGNLNLTCYHLNPRPSALAQAPSFGRRPIAVKWLEERGMDRLQVCPSQHRILRDLKSRPSWSSVGQLWNH